MKCYHGFAIHPSSDGLEFKLQLVFVDSTLKRELLQLVFVDSTLKRDLLTILWWQTI
jgi:hypothetical protein